MERFTPPLKSDIMCKQALDVSVVRPRVMAKYLYNHGWHFNRKCCEYAVSLMRKKNNVNGQMEAVQMMTKEQVDEMLKRHNVKLQNDVGHDAVYVANRGKTCYLKSSIPDEQHLAMYVKDEIDAPDMADGTIMRQWYAKMIADGMLVDWFEMLEDEEM